MNNNRVQLSLMFLLLLGLFVMAWGVVGPAAVGATKSEAIVNLLDLPHDPAIYQKLREFQDVSEIRRAETAFALGVLIVLAASIGLTGTTWNKIENSRSDTS